MSNVITLPSSTSQLQSFIQDWLARRQQQQQSDAALKQNQSQFDTSNALDVQRTNAQTGMMGAQTEGLKSSTAIEAAKAKVQGFVDNTIKPLVANGQADKAAQLTQAFIRSNPDTAVVLQGYASERPQLPSDTAAANTQTYAANETGKAASGSPDVQARAFTQENALGKAMSPQQFSDQAQRQPQAGDQSTPYGKTLAIEGERRPTANAQLQADTQVQMAREKNATDPAVVSGWVNRVKGGEIAAQDLSKYVTDKNTLKAVQNEVGVAGGAIVHPLSPAGSKQLAEIEPVKMQVDKIISLLEPHKDDNLGGLRGATIKYKMGFSSDNPEELYQSISRLSLGQIQAIMPFATKSRNYQYIQDIKQHTWDVKKDTFKNMYDKALIIQENLKHMEDSIGKYERVGGTGASTSSGASSGTVIRYDDSGKRIQ